MLRPADRFLGIRARGGQHPTIDRHADPDIVSIWLTTQAVIAKRLRARAARPGGAPMSETRGRKVSLYFPIELVAELESEAQRTGRKKSQLVRYAWLLARQRIRAFQAPDLGPHSCPACSPLDTAVPR